MNSVSAKASRLVTANHIRSNQLGQTTDGCVCLMHGFLQFIVFMSVSTNSISAHLYVNLPPAFLILKTSLQALLTSVVSNIMKQINMLGSSGLDIYAFSMSDLIYPLKTSTFCFWVPLEDPNIITSHCFLPNCRAVSSVLMKSLSISLFSFFGNTKHEQKIYFSI